MLARRKNLLSLALAGSLMVALSGCGDTGAAGGDSDSAIKVGVIGDFSAGGADMGVAMRQGIEIAADEFNTEGGVDGREVELVFYDDEGDAQKATTGAQHLIDRENVVAVLGNDSTGSAIATVNVTQSRDVPQIVPVAQSPEVVEGDNEYTFRTSATNPLDIQILIDYVEEQGWTDVGVLHDTSAYGLSGIGLIQDQIEESGLNLVRTERYEVGTADLTPQASNLRSAGAEAVIMWSLGADGARFAINTRGMGWDVPLLGGRGLLFNVFGELAGEQGEGTYATASFDQSKSEAAAFAEVMEEEYGTTDSIDFAVLGYDAGRVLFDAMTRLGPEDASDRAQLRDAIEETQDFPLVHGRPEATVSFTPGDPEGANEDAVVVVTYTEDGWSAHDN